MAMISVVPDFSLVKFDKDKTEVLVNLLQFFDAVVKGESLDVGYNEIEKMLSEELNIDFSVVHNIRLVLIESLMYYMTVWPGWQRFEEYRNGHLAHKDWFERFRQYLILKTRFVIKSALQFVQTEEIKKDACTQTDVDYSNKKRKQYAPYAVCIAGPAPVLNNVVFVKSEKNVLVKQFPIKEWQQLKLSELFNWPNVSVELKFLDISLSRTIKHQINRYMSLSDDMVILPEVDYVIYAKKLSETGEQKSYSYDFIKSYFQQLNDTLKKIPGISVDRVTELQTLFWEFLQDILEVNLYKKTMCTNMCVGYNMGKSRYVRSRKMVKSKDRNVLPEIINFYELVIPQVDFELRSFVGEQDDTDRTSITFKSLNKLENSLKSRNMQDIASMILLINNCIVYKCTACCEAFVGRSARTLAIKHFELAHKGEQSLLCYKCHQEFEVPHLAYKRWSHICTV